jgi:exopolysaccharide biosynthesis polyprenyl glycosylphosphotransferase
MAESFGSRDAILRRALFRRALGVADILAAACTLLLLHWAAGTRPLRPGAFLLIPVVVAASKLTGLYDHDDVVIERSSLDEAPAIFQLATLCSLVVWLAETALFQGPLNRTPVFALWLSLFLLLALFRMMARIVIRSVAPEQRCLLIGDEASHERLRAKLSNRNRLGTMLTGWVDIGSTAGGPHSDALGAIDDLPSLVRSHNVHRVIVAGWHGTDEVLDLIRLVQSLDVRVSLMPRMLEVVGTSMEFENVGGMPLVGVRAFHITRSSELVKRAMDIVCACLGLVLLVPLFAVIALAIKLDSSGPVFFLQTRIGRHGARFRMVKFRSMVEDALVRQAELEHLNEVDGLFKIELDPRITRVGRWLRKTCLDELPQLVNVLRGEMSLVGPRPLVLSDDQRVEGWHRQRLHLKPGMTGPWQIMGPARLPLREMVAIDYLYVANWSLWTDVKILARTASFVLRASGR